jgi:hypothetical protein
VGAQLVDELAQLVAVNHMQLDGDSDVERAIVQRAVLLAQALRGPGIVGSKGLTGVERLVLGSVSERVVRMAVVLTTC